MSYLVSEAMTLSRGNMALPSTTVAGASPFTRTRGASSMASFRTRWLAAASLVSYAVEPYLGTLPLTFVVQDGRAGQPLSVPDAFGLVRHEVTPRDVDSSSGGSGAEGASGSLGRR